MADESDRAMILALHDVRLRFPAFELSVNLEITQPRTAIFGPSGAGKTSLLELIAGLRQPEAGTIEMDGAVFADATRAFALPVRHRGLGYLPQGDLLFPHLSVRRNLVYGAKNSLVDSFAKTTALLEIDTLLARNVRDLSQGEKQRVALGRALLSSPRLLLLDEPLTALNASLKTKMLDHFRTVFGEWKVPLLYVTHDPSEVHALCEEVVVIQDGRIAGQGRPADMLSA